MGPNLKLNVYIYEARKGAMRKQRGRGPVTCKRKAEEGLVRGRTGAATGRTGRTGAATGRTGTATGRTEAQGRLGEKDM